LAVVGYDVFVSYASEDAEVAEAIVSGFGDAGLRVWHDRSILGIGDHLLRDIDQALAGSRFGVAILSPTYFEKEYTTHELELMAERELAGDIVILPVWHKVTQEYVYQKWPRLAGRLATSTDAGLQQCVSDLRRAITSGRPIARSTPATAHGLVDELRTLTHPQTMRETELKGARAALEALRGCVRKDSVGTFGELASSFGQQVGLGRTACEDILRIWCQRLQEDPWWGRCIHRRAQSYAYSTDATPWGFAEEAYCEGYLLPALLTLQMAYVAEGYRERRTYFLEKLRAAPEPIRAAVFAAWAQLIAGPDGDPEAIGADPQHAFDVLSSVAQRDFRIARFTRPLNAPGDPKGKNNPPEECDSRTL
jgi:hypothetical protein